MTTSFTATTRGVRVTVRTLYLPDQSDPDDNTYVWAYEVRIENTGAETVQLLRRTWRITDERGHTEVVHGDGVVGEQPTLRPGQVFEYTSGTHLATPSGFMVGTYHMVAVATGEAFDAAVPAFSLDSPGERSHLH